MVDFFPAVKRAGDTVPDTWEEIYNQLSPYQNVTLPLVGSVDVSYTFSLPFRLKVGHVMIFLFSSDQVGLDWTNKIWSGFRTDTWDNSPDFYLTGWKQLFETTFDGSGSHALVDMPTVLNLTSFNVVDLRMRFTVSSHNSNAPYVLRCRFGCRVFKPTHFVAWVP